MGSVVRGAGGRDGVYQGQRIRFQAEPELSAAETLADVEAIRVVERMYQTEPRVAGTSYSPSQLLFLNIAQVFLTQEYGPAPDPNPF